MLSINTLKKKIVIAQLKTSKETIGSLDIWAALLKQNKRNTNMKKKNNITIDTVLRQEVIDLYNNLFTWKIDQDEKFVSNEVMQGIVGLYGEMGGSPLDIAFIAQESMDAIDDENLKLDICKKLLVGEKVDIPGMVVSYCIWGVFYSLKDGKKIDREINNNNTPQE